MSEEQAKAICWRLDALRVELKKLRCLLANSIAVAHGLTSKKEFAEKVLGPMLAELGLPADRGGKLDTGTRKATVD